MKTILALLMLVSTNAFAASWATENESGGFIILTEQPCELKKWKELYPYKVILTRDKLVSLAETDPNKIAFGCYTVPKDQPPIEGMFPIVSLVVVDPFSGEEFKDEHPLTIYLPIKELKI
jgi:hypothetical protein